jgi:hypothetical protein
MEHGVFLQNWFVFFRKTLWKMCCPWWQYDETVIICFHTELKCDKPFLIVNVSRLESTFRKALCHLL